MENIPPVNPAFLDTETPAPEPAPYLAETVRPDERLARMSDVVGPELMRLYYAEDAAAEAEARRASYRHRPSQRRHF